MSKPAWLNRLEEYRVAIEAVAALSTLVAFAALYASIQGTRAAQEDLRLQQEVSQPVFQVGAIQGEDGTLKALKVTNPSGIYLNAQVRTDDYLALGRGTEEYARDEASLVWRSPAEELVLVPFYYWDEASAGGDVANFVPYEEPPMMDFVRSWRATSGRRAEVGVVTYITITYRDMFRQKHELYFKLGGNPEEEAAKLPSLGRNLKPGDVGVPALWLEPDRGKTCAGFYPEDREGRLLDTVDYFDKVPHDERNSSLRTLYEEVESQQAQEIRDTCA
jgi:hypothetical protein